MKHHILFAGLATAFMLLGGSTLCAQETEIRIVLRPEGKSCYEKKKGEYKVVVENEMGKDTALTFASVRVPVPKAGINETYQPGGNTISIGGVQLPIVDKIKKPVPMRIGGLDINKVCGDTTPPPPPPPPPSTTVFAPDEVAQEQYRSKSASFGTGCKGVKAPDVPGSAIVYNYQDQCFCYFQDGKRVDQKRLRPRVDEDLHFSVVSYHPYRDSISVSTEFANRNQEYGEQVVALLNQQWKGGAETDVKKTVAQDTVASGSVKATSTTAPAKTALIATFSKEMARFYHEQRNSPALTLDFLHRCVQHIDTQIAAIFDIQNVTPENILAAGKKWIEKSSLAADKKKELSDQLDEGVGYYRRITTYNIIRFKPVQIEDADLTEVTVKTFRDRKLQDDKPRPYRYFNKGGFKIDFSFGVFASGLVDHNFTTAPVNDTVRVAGQPDKVEVKGKVVREKSDSYNFGLGILSHYYSRWDRCVFGPRFNVSLTGGLLVDTDKRTKYLVGGSLLLGSEQRAVISGGCIFGKVRRLAEGLEEGKSLLSTTAGQVTQVPTREVNQHSWFVSLTYNFGTLPKKK